MEKAMGDFNAWCCLPHIHGAIGGIHTNISITRAPSVFSVDYYDFKIGGYSMVSGGALVYYV